MELYLEKIDGTRYIIHVACDVKRQFFRDIPSSTEKLLQSIISYNLI